MEGRRHHSISVALAVALVLASLTGAGAEEEQQLPPDIHNRLANAVVYTTPDSAVVEAQKFSPGGEGSSKGGRGGSNKCWLEPDTAPLTSTNWHIYAAHPDERSFYLVCDGERLGLIWRRIDPEPGSRPSESPREIAESLRREIPMPDVTVRINPDTGLTGSESWFWIEGYEGETITNGTDAFGALIEVEARPTRYEWLFGDGASKVVDSTGRAYPERSEITHVFERASSTGHEVRVRFVFEVRYRIAGGPWISLPGITRSTAVAYRVRESQAVISR